MPRNESTRQIIRGPRPEGTDGSDHEFRMIIENKYKRIAVLKKYTRILFYCQVPLVVLLGIWCAVPVVVGDPYPYQIMIMLGLEVLAIISYTLAAIGQRKERMVFVKTYGILLAILTAEQLLIRFWYHVKYPKTELYPYLLSRYFAIGYMKNADHLKIALTVWEATLDGSLFFVLVAASFCCRSYVEEKRAPNPIAPTGEVAPAESQRIKRD